MLASSAMDWARSATCTHWFTLGAVGRASYSQSPNPNVSSLCCRPRRILGVLDLSNNLNNCNLLLFSRRCMGSVGLESIGIGRGLSMRLNSYPFVWKKHEETSINITFTRKLSLAEKNEREHIQRPMKKKWENWWQHTEKLLSGSSCRKAIGASPRHSMSFEVFDNDFPQNHNMSY